jgi:hypothetical protein
MEEERRGNHESTRIKSGDAGGWCLPPRTSQR